MTENKGENKLDELLKERYELAKGRLSEICTETVVEENFLDFFHKEAAFLLKTGEILERDQKDFSMVELQSENSSLYEELFPENYGQCYGNPAYAARKLGEYGKAFSFLYTELRGTIAYAYEKKYWDYTVAVELFLEIYAAFEGEEKPSVKSTEDILRSYVNDYCQDMMEQRIAEGVDTSLDFAVRIIMDSDLTDLRYLYQYGEYISVNETGVAEFLNRLSEEQINNMARTYTEGYRIGFINGRKDITKKKSVNIRYNLGFERMVRAAIIQFREMGLEPVIYRHATHAVNKRGTARIGFTGGNPNPQFDYDHRQDQALFMDSDFVQRKLRSMQNAYEKYKDQMKVILLDGYEDVLIKVRDLVYDKHVLLTHPQASSLKPNQTPYRSVVVYPKGEEDNIKDIMLIDKCIQVYQEWQDIAPSPKSYQEKVANDFKTIDLSVIDNIIPRIS